MTEPVAYIQIKDGKVYSMLRSATSNDEYTPVYTADQLHPRVKMTQEEFDEFKKLLSVGISTIYEAFDVIDSDRGEMNEFEQLYNRLFTNGVNEQVKQQNEFAKLWESLSTCSAEETIEIVPDMKWFVRSKEPDDNGYYRFRSGVKEFGDYYFTKDKNENKIAYPFDTKEEAELWTNPLTEAVQLPVEGE